MKKIVLVLGAQGFLGSAFCQYTRQHYPKQYSVIGLSRQKKTGFIQGDLLNKDHLAGILAKIKPDYIFHFAGGRVPDQKKMRQMNVETTKNLFAALKRSGLNARVIIPGSAAEYGKPRSSKLITETHARKAVSLYGEIKLKQTQLALGYGLQGYDVVVGRVFNITGAGLPADLAVGKFTRDIALIEKNKLKPILETKDLSGKRDFLDVQDVSAAFWDIAQYGKSGETYNICSGKSSTIRQLLKKLIKFSTMKDMKIKEMKDQNSGSFDAIGSSRKLRQLNAWKQKVKLDQSLKETLNHYRKIA